MDMDRTIGALARDARVHVETVRYYEQRGLLKQPRRTGGWRRYDEEALRVLRFVKRAQELGFSLDEVHELLSLRTSKNARTCANVRTAAKAKLANVEAKLRDLDAIRRTLAALVQSCNTDGAAEACPILGSLDQRGGRSDA